MGCSVFFPAVYCPAPPVQANLVNYLWPLGIVLMAPLLLPGMRLRPLHVLAALLDSRVRCD